MPWEVARWMTKNPVTVESDQRLSAVRQKMDKGNFHRLPVVDDGKLVGMISDRDLRQHAGALESVKVNGVMTRPVVTLTPTTMLEQAANLLIKHKIGGLPVVAQGRVVDILTATDLMARSRRSWAALRKGSRGSTSPWTEILRSLRWSCN